MEKSDDRRCPPFFWRDNGDFHAKFVSDPVRSCLTSLAVFPLVWWWCEVVCGAVNTLPHLFSQSSVHSSSSRRPFLESQTQWGAKIILLLQL